MSKEEAMSEVVQEDEHIDNPDVLAKYKIAADITNAALTEVIRAVAPGKKVVDLCILGDDFITRKTSEMFKKGKGEKKVEKGIAFPTCINVNNIVCHYSALTGDELTIQDGDLVRIDLGTHIDGYIAVGAQSMVVQSMPAPITGKAADVIAAANAAAQVALALIKPGKKNTEVVSAWSKVADAYKVNLCEGVLSHQLQRYVIDGAKCILQKPTIEQKTEEHAFEENEVYAVDIVVTSGEGKLREMDAKPTIYKRAADQIYALKTAAGRQALTEIRERFVTMPFTIRALADTRSRIGIVECYRHNLVDPYPVLYEKRGEFVAQIKFTVLVTKNGTQRITGVASQEVQSTFTIDDQEVKDLLAAGASSTTANKKKKKKKAAAASTSTSAAAEGASTSAAAESMDTSS